MTVGRPSVAGALRTFFGPIAFAVAVPCGGLALIMAVAISLHIRRNEYSAIGPTGLLFLMVAIVA